MVNFVYVREQAYYTRTLTHALFFRLSLSIQEKKFVPGSYAETTILGTGLFQRITTCIAFSFGSLSFIPLLLLRGHDHDEDEDDDRDGLEWSRREKQVISLFSRSEILLLYEQIEKFLLNV